MAKYLIGIGNYLKGDDGIGLHIIEFIQANQLENGFEAIDISNDLTRLLQYFNAKTSKLVLVDCAMMAREPGETAVFALDEIRSQKEIQTSSTHTGDLLSTIAMAEKLDYKLPELIVLAIQPYSTELKPDLSDELKTNLAKYADQAIKLINS